MAVVEIDTWTELQAINSGLAGDYKLTRSLTTGDDDYATVGAAFVKIGTSAAPFTGTFDGQGYTISGLTLAASNFATNGNAMFCKIDSAGEIKNFVLDGTVVSDGSESRDYYAALAGYIIGGTFTNIKCLNSTIAGYWYVGGFAGYTADCTITRCMSVNAAISGRRFATCPSAGFVVATDTGSNITRCAAKGGTISTPDGYRSGGFVSEGNAQTFANCYSTTAQTDLGSDSANGGFHAYGSATTTNCYAAHTTESPNLSNGWSGGTPTATACYYDSTLAGRTDSGTGYTPKTTAQMKAQATFSGWDFTSIWSISEGVDYPRLQNLEVWIVPDVDDGDVTQANAETAITGSGLVVGTITTAYSPTVAAGNVISQDPAASTEVAAGSSVNLVVSLGAAPSGKSFKTTTSGRKRYLTRGKLGIMK